MVNLYLFSLPNHVFGVLVVALGLVLCGIAHRQQRATQPGFKQRGRKQ